MCCFLLENRLFVISFCNALRGAVGKVRNSWQVHHKKDKLNPVRLVFLCFYAGILHDLIVPLLCNVNPSRLHAIDLR